MSNQTIRGVKIIKPSGIEVSYVFHDTMNYNDEEHDVPRERKEKIFADPKPQFFTALNLLKPHLLSLTDLGFAIDAKYIKARMALEDPRMDKWRVDEVIVAGDNEDTTIVLVGHRITKRGANIKFRTDPTLIFNTESYEFSGNLAEDWGSLEDEVEALLGGNYYPSGQLELEYK